MEELTMESRKFGPYPLGILFLPSTTKLSKFVLNRCVECGLSQTQLSARMGHPFTMLNILLNALGSGEHCGRSILQELAVVLQCEVNELTSLIPIKKEPTSKLGRLIVELCEKARMSPRDLAKKAGVSYRLVYELQFRYSRMKCSTAKKFSMALGVDVSVFAEFYVIYSAKTTHLGLFISQRRRLLGLHLQEVADVLKISHQALSQIEKGKTILAKSGERLAQLAVVLKVDVETLLALSRKEGLVSVEKQLEITEILASSSQ